MDNRLLSKWIF